MDNCLNPGPRPELCTELTLQTEDQYNSCHVPNLVDEKVEGECMFFVSCILNDSQTRKCQIYQHFPGVIRSKLVLNQLLS